MHMRIQSGMAFFLPGFKLATFLIQSGNYHATIFNDIYISARTEMYFLI